MNMAMYTEITLVSKCLSRKKSCDTDAEEAANIDLGPLPDSENDSQIDWVYLEDVPDYMKCNIICCNVFVSPQLLTCCGRSICKKCIECHLQSAAVLAGQKPSCPVCRKEDFRQIKNTALEQSIDQLKVQCPYKRNGCDWTGTRRNGRLHLKECDVFPIDCPNGCGCQFERCKFPDHITKCPLQYVGCSFQQVGCSSAGELFLHGEMTQKHSVDNIHHHLLRIAQFNAQVSCECRSILTSFCSKRDKSTKEIIDEALLPQKKALMVLKSTINSLEEHLKKILARQKSGSEEMAICLRELKKKDEQARNIEASYIVMIDEVEALPLPRATGISCLPVVFTISRFRKRMITDDRWLSSPFYTHVGGYKMCLSVYPNGNDSITRGKYVSVYIHFMTGEFDDHLNWPFSGAIFTLTAICQRRNCCSRSVHLQLVKENTRHIRSRQMDGTFGYGYGLCKFLDHRYLPYFLIPNSDSFEIMVYHIQFLPL